MEECCASFFWLYQYKYIFKIKEGTSASTSQSHNPGNINTISIPPELPEIPEANDEVIESNMITKLMA